MPITTPPTDYPDWATNASHAVGPNVGQPNKLDLTTEITEGNVNGVGFAPDGRKFNRWQNLVGQWVRFFFGEIAELKRTRVRIPEDFLPPGTTVSAVDSAGGWHTYIAAMIAAAVADDNVIGFTEEKTYRVRGGVALVDDLSIVGHRAKIKSDAARTTWSALDATGVSRISIFDIEFDGSLQGNGNTSSFGHMLHLADAEDVLVKGCKFKDIGVATVTGAACGVMMHGVPKRITFEDVKFSQLATSFGNGAFAVNSLFGVGAEDLNFINCDWSECTGFKTGLNLDGVGVKRCKVTGFRFNNGSVHGALVGYSAVVDTEWDVTFSNGSFYNCAWSGLYLTGQLGTKNHGVKLKNVTFNYCGGGGSSFGVSSIFTGHTTLGIDDVEILNSGFDPVSGVRPFAGDVITRPATADGAIDFSARGLKIVSPSNGPGAIQLYNVDRMILRDVEIDAPWGIGLTTGEFYSETDEPGARRLLDFKDISVKTSDSNWYGIDVQGYLGPSPAVLNWDNVNVEGPSAGTPLASVFHSAALLGNCKGSVRNSSFSGFDRDAFSTGITLNEETAEYLSNGDLRLETGNKISDNHHGILVSSVAAGTSWLPLEEQQFSGNSVDVSVTGSGSARYKRAVSVVGRKILHSDIVPTVTGQGNWNAHDEMLHSNGTRARCTVGGSGGTAGTWSAYA